MKYFLIIASLLALSACSTRVDMGAAADLAALDAEVVPRVDTSVAIRTFDKYCYRNRARPGSVISTLKTDGYRLLVTDRQSRMFGYAHPRRPMVAVIDQPGEPACLVFVQRDPQLAGAYNRFIRARHSNARPVSIPDLDNVVVAPGNPSLVFARDVDGTDELMMLIVE